jgi:hypothetical protein
MGSAPLNTRVLYIGNDVTPCLTAYELESARTCKVDHKLNVSRLQLHLP